MSRFRAFLSPCSSLATLIALAFVGSLSCSDDPSDPGEPEETNVAVESSNRETASIGPAGGTVSTTSNAGVTYTLDVPAGALPGDVEIAITPVTSIKGLPYSGGIEGAVRLGPSGLVLLKPAELTIGTTASPTGTQRLVGFLYEGDADTIDETVAGQIGSEISVLVSHFSGAGAALAEPEDLDNSGCEELGPDASLLWILINCVQEGDQTAFVNLMRSRLDVIRAAIQTGTGDDLRDAVAAYSEWAGMIYWEDRAQVYMPDALGEFETEMVGVDEIVTQRLSSAIAETKAVCDAQDLQWLIRLFEYRAVAHAVFRESVIPAQLEDGVILADLCATAVVEGTLLADPLPLNQDRSLDIDFALDINGTLADAVFDVVVTDPDNIVRTPTGRTDARGVYTTVVRRIIEEGASFHITGSLILPVFGTGGLAVTTVPITVEEEVFRGGNARITTNLASSVPASLPVELTIVVERLSNPGYLPVENADVDLLVQGGTANPEQLVTDLGGQAATTITIAGGAEELIIDITVSKDDVNLGSKRVQAAIAEGGIVLRTNTYSYVSTFTPLEDPSCTGSGDDFEQVEQTGHVSIAAQTDEHCDNPLRQTSTRSGFVNLISNPGIAVGGQSATMTLQSSGNAYAMIDECVDPFFCTDVRNSSTALFHVEFDVVGAPMNFEFDGAHQSTGTALSSMHFTLTRQSGPSPSIINWNGSTPDVLIVGNLSPGYYVLEYYSSKAVTAVPNGPAQTATWNTEGTLTITPAPATSAVRLSETTRPREARGR